MLQLTDYGILHLCLLLFESTFRFALLSRCDRVNPSLLSTIMTLSSATEVISAPELLEQILAALPMRDLLVTVPLVSKTWHSMTLLPTLQRALFFRPDPSVATHVPNPLLSEMFPPFFDRRNEMDWDNSIDVIMGMPWSKAPDAFRRKEASWRRMLVSQPPAQTLVVNQKSSAMGGTSQRKGVLEDLTLSMGVLSDVTLMFVDDDTSFHVIWHDDNTSGLTLMLHTSVGCVFDEERELEKKFLNRGAGTVCIPFEYDFGLQLSDEDEE
ncbi:hypothetical protein R3P38DRAFT_1868605 [Favolaschia claudopus]|uniref:F-box domain-containing protein n=1 Tax=Favolaschia claudopus TaxID=2862362 RepID=A0AAW0D7J7_9AGAR